MVDNIAFKDTFRGSIYHSDHDLVSRSFFRRLTFGLNPYGEKTITLRSRLRLIITAFFTMYIGGKLRHDVYFSKYIELHVKRNKRQARAWRIIDANNPKNLPIIQQVVSEKMILDHVSAETGIKYLN